MKLPDALEYACELPALNWHLGYYDDLLKKRWAFHELLVTCMPLLVVVLFFTGNNRIFSDKNQWKVFSWLGLKQCCSQTWSCWRSSRSGASVKCVPVLRVRYCVFSSLCSDCDLDWLLFFRGSRALAPFQSSCLQFCWQDCLLLCSELGWGTDLAVNC